MIRGPVLFASRAVPEVVRWALGAHGYCRLREAVGDAALGTLRTAVDALLAAPPPEEGLTWWSPAAGGGLLVQRISRANLYHRDLADLVERSALLRNIGRWAFECPQEQVRVATGREGSDGVVMVSKDPENVSEHADLRWHRDDTFTTHLPINPFLNCGIYLDKANRERGALLLVPPSYAFPTRAAETTDLVEGEVCVEAEAGDVVIHRADVWHRSGPNRRPGTRRRVLYGNVFRSSS